MVPVSCTSSYPSQFSRHNYSISNSTIASGGSQGATCASNVVLIPQGYTKPSDKLRAVKIALFRRYIELYGAKILPGLQGFKEEMLPAWYEDLRQHWIEPILPESWEERIEALLEFRSKALHRIFERAQPNLE